MCIVKLSYPTLIHVKKRYIIFAWDCLFVAVSFNAAWIFLSKVKINKQAICEFMRNLKFTYFHIKNLLRNITWWLVYPGVETSFDCSGLEGSGVSRVPQLPFMHNQLKAG